MHRVINFVIPSALKSNFLDCGHVFVPFAAAVTTKHHENVAVISSNNNLMCTGSQFLNNHATDSP